MAGKLHATARRALATIEYFYSAYSAFAYLGSRKFAEIAKGHTIIHRPVDLSKVVASGGAAKFGNRSAAHRDYYIRRKIERWSEYRDAPVMTGFPTHHSTDISLANCMLIAGIETGLDIQPLAYAMLQSHWRDNSDLSDRAVLSALGKGLGLEANALLEAADSPHVRDLYTADTQEAIDRSVFGSPTYFVDGNMFYGRDRLDLVERALVKSFAGKWP